MRARIGGGGGAGGGDGGGSGGGVATLPSLLLGVLVLLT